MEYLIETLNLSKKIKNNDILKNINLHVPKGKIYCLLGNNGVGKSTLLKILCGMMPSSEGKVIFDNHLWTRKDLNNIGSLIEAPSLYGNLTAEENLKIISILKNVSINNSKDLLSLVGLNENLNKKCLDYSMGMKERLGIAMALVGNPKLLILDEPLNGLDPSGINDLRILLKNLKEKGMTIIISSHILSEVQAIADYIGFLKDGELKLEKEYNQESLEELFI